MRTGFTYDQCVAKRRALFDPFSQSSDFVLRKWLAKLGGRHPLVFVRTRHSANQFARLRFARHDRDRARLKFTGRNLCIIQPQAGLALSVVGTVTRIAFVRQNRPDVAIEVNRLLGQRQGTANASPAATEIANESRQCFVGCIAGRKSLAIQRGRVLVHFRS